MYLLDTNICIYAIKGTYPRLKEHLLCVPPEDVFVSAITLGEMEYGAASRWGERTREIMHAFLSNFEIIPFTESDSVLFGKIRAQVETAGNPVGLLDLMIGVQGITNRLTVVTHNTKEFMRIPGIVPEDWTE